MSDVMRRPCPSCKKVKPFSAYYKNRDKHAVYCRECEGKNKFKSRLKITYGLTVEQYDELFARQGGVCAICKRQDPKKGRRLGVDHDHRTGKIRGLLCGPCNRGLGLLGDTAEILLEVLAYVRREAPAA